jgi:hypothetical protein
MTNLHKLTPPRFVHVSIALVTTLALLSVAPASATSIFSVGAKETLLTASQRKSRGLNNWVDGSLGVVYNGNGTYDFYGANGTKPVRTTGTLSDPTNTKKKSVKIANLPKKTFNYVSGGPIYTDSATGTRLMIYHAEKHGKSSKDFYSVLGLAVATDSTGLNFRDLGTIIEPNVPVGQNAYSMDVGGGSFAVMNDQLHVYYRDFTLGGGSSELAVARAPVSQILENALAGVGTQFTKYYNGNWSEAGIGGRASALEVGNPNNNWSSVSYNDYLNQLVMVTADWAGGQPDLYLATSSDGINFSQRQALALDPGEQFYPTIVGTGADPTRSGQSFYVYYTDSKKGSWNRWSDAQLARRLVTFDPSIPPVVPPPPGPDPNPNPDPGPEPIPMEWLRLTDYRDEFQPSGPAAGWTYAWNPTGKLGDASKFAPLVWSDSAQAYNTTGVATMVPDKKSHNDDYLQLGSGWGHPGKPKYMPIVGYTIQEEDGAGDYRIVESAIQKGDGTSSKGEDGLGVLVYLNNTLLGSAASVATNGALASFNRELGNLNVGDTIWVMIDPLKSQSYDAFMNFDFSLEKLVPIEGGMAAMSFMAVAVPEPSSVALALLAISAVGLRRRREV